MTAYAQTRLPQGAWEDAVQTAATAILERTGPADAAGYRAWCFAILRNKIADHWRSQRQRLEVVAARNSSVEDRVDARITLDRIAALAATLSQAERDALHRIISEEAGPMTTAQRKARSRLRQQLKRRLYGEDE